MKCILMQRHCPGIIICWEETHSMNAFDRHRKSLTAWCEDCNEVFDILWIANMHRDKKRHRIKVTEFWITGRR
jgi:hypothetical protein